MPNQKGVDETRTYEFRNWTDIDDIVPLAAPSSFADEWGVNDRKVALYSGNIANKQGIEIAVEAARLLANPRDILFVICGNGQNREALELQASGLSNVLFRDLQPRERLPDLLGLAHVHLLLQAAQAAQAAELMLPSKLANMLASGRPVVATAVIGTDLAQEVEGAGLLAPPGNLSAFANAIQQIMDDASLAKKLPKGGSESVSYPHLKRD